eukprot:11123456-Ditylum_brightwellii.AAC.2
MEMTRTVPLVKTFCPTPELAPSPTMSHYSFAANVMVCHEGAVQGPWPYPGVPCAPLPLSASSAFCLKDTHAQTPLQCNYHWIPYHLLLSYTPLCSLSAPDPVLSSAPLPDIPGQLTTPPLSND